MKLNRPDEQQPLLVSDTALETAAIDIYEAVVDDDIDEDNEDAVWLREQRTLNKATHWLRRPSAMMISASTFGVAFATSSGEATRNIIMFKLACNYLAWSSNTGVCNPNETQVLVSNLQLSFMILAGVFLFVALGKIGPLSDQYGRKPFFALFIACILAGRISRYFLMYHYETLHFGLMVCTEIIANLCGGIVTFITLTSCYISDVVEPHERIYSLGLSMAGLFVGLSLGPVAGNLLLKKASGKSKAVSFGQSSAYTAIERAEFVPLQFEIVAFILSLAFVVFVVPELRSAKARGKSRSLSRSLSISSLTPQEGINVGPLQPTWFQALNPNFLRPLRLFLLPEDVVTNAHKRNLPRERIVILILVCVDCLLSAIAQPLGQVVILYGIYQFDWTSIEIGHLLAVACSSRAVALLVFSPLLTRKVFPKWFGFTVMKRQYDLIDFSMSSLGFFSEAMGFLLLYYSPNTACFLLAMVLNSFSSFASPALNSTIIKYYPESMVGEVFGALAIVKNVFTIIAPLLVLPIYNTSISRWQRPEMIFLILSIFMFVCLFGILSTKWLSGLTRETRPVLSRSGSTVSYNDSHPVTIPNPPPPNFTELHRKNSFVHQQRSQS